MTQVFSEENFSSREDTLLKNTSGPTTSEVIILGSDTYVSPKKQQYLDFAANQPAVFHEIDKQVDGFIGVLGKDLSSIQATTTNPDILVRQTEHVLDMADRIIDGAVADKIAMRQRNQQNLEEAVSVGEANNDLEVSIENRRRRVIEALIANRNSREIQLESEVEALKTSLGEKEDALESYRQFLSETDSSSLLAFDAHFIRQSPSGSGEVATTDEAVLTRTQELQQMLGNVALAPEATEIKKPRTAQTIIIMASRAIYDTMMRRPIGAMKKNPLK